MGRLPNEFSCTQRDCWMCMLDKCQLLTERCAGDSGCKFKKTQRQVDEGRQRAHDRLEAMGKPGQKLIKKFEYNKHRAGLW